MISQWVFSAERAHEQAPSSAAYSSTRAGLTTRLNEFTRATVTEGTPSIVGCSESIRGSPLGRGDLVLALVVIDAEVPHRQLRQDALRGEVPLGGGGPHGVHPGVLEGMTEQSCAAFGGQSRAPAAWEQPVAEVRGRLVPGTCTQAPPADERVVVPARPVAHSPIWRGPFAKAPAPLCLRLLGGRRTAREVAHDRFVGDEVPHELQVPIGRGSQAKPGRREFGEYGHNVVVP